MSSRNAIAEAKTWLIGALWAIVLALAGVVYAAIDTRITGLESGASATEAPETTRAIEALEQRVVRIEGQTDRIENKVDELLRRPN